MIARAYIAEWQQHAPWPTPSMVEQDLVICRALVEIFNRPALKENLAFRGGTAMFKLHLPAVRYSEDIDLVQVKAGGIGPLMNEIRDALSPWLGEPKWKQSQGRVTFRYRFESEEGLPLSLKVEINSREHFSVFGLRKHPFAVDSRWFSGKTEILTYDREELLGTKLRALYQRKKGRDLFDLFGNAWINGERTTLARIDESLKKPQSHPVQSNWNAGRIPAGKVARIRPECAVIPIQLQMDIFKADVSRQSLLQKSV